MARFVLACLLSLVFLCACTRRVGYEMFRQRGYLECIRHSPDPEECRFAPDYELYHRELERHSGDEAK